MTRKVREAVSPLLWPVAWMLWLPGRAVAGMVMPKEKAARKIARALGLKGDLIGQAAKVLLGVYKTWWECDASLLEINPLCVVKTRDGHLVEASVYFLRRDQISHRGFERLVPHPVLNGADIETCSERA